MIRQSIFIMANNCVAIALVFAATYLAAIDKNIFIVLVLLAMAFVTSSVYTADEAAK